MAGVVCQCSGFLSALRVVVYEAIVHHTLPGHNAGRDTTTPRRFLFQTNPSVQQSLQLLPIRK